MLVRVCIHLDPKHVPKMIHATRYEPAYVNIPEGLIGYILPESRFRAILEELGNTGICQFEAFLLGRA